MVLPPPLQGKETAGADDIARALREGAGEAAYRAVMRPVEGTILTVVRKSAEGLGQQRLAAVILLRLMVFVQKKAFAALNETPPSLLC